MIGFEQSLRIDGRQAYVDLPGVEAIERFRCFGGDCAVLVVGSDGRRRARHAALAARRRLLDWHGQFSRFEPDSELSRLNRDPRKTVPVSPMMAHFAQTAVRAAAATGGLVDPTLVTEIERAGYAGHFDTKPLALSHILSQAPPRAIARPNKAARWRQIIVDLDRGTVTRPPGVRLDSGGLAKGLFGDLLATQLSGHEAFAVQAAGDVRFGGIAELLRPVEVRNPLGDGVLHVFGLAQGAAATSGIDRRNWLGANSRPAHHLLDPATGRPAFTGIIQATALAPTGVEAELRSKAVLLSGPAGARAWLAHGGLIVYDDGTFDRIDPPLQTARSA